MAVQRGMTQRLASYVQVRGSIPLVWNQLPNLKWEPAVSAEQDEP